MSLEIVPKSQTLLSLSTNRLIITAPISYVLISGLQSPELNSVNMLVTEQKIVTSVLADDDPACSPCIPKSCVYGEITPTKHYFPTLSDHAANGEELSQPIAIIMTATFMVSAWSLKVEK